MKIHVALEGLDSLRYYEGECSVDKVLDEALRLSYVMGRVLGELDEEDRGGMLRAREKLVGEVKRGLKGACWRGAR